MASRNAVMTVHPSLGGLDVATDPSILDPNMLTAATNIEYLEDGRRTKRLGVLQYAPTSSFAGTFATTTPGPLLVSSASNVRALADSWNYGASLTPDHRMIAVASASIARSTGDGNWTLVTTASSFGSSGNLATNIMLGQSVTTSGGTGATAVISDGVTRPIGYNVTTTTLFAPTTGANWPIFESASYHLARMWMVGLSTAAGYASRVQYTAAGNICDTTGTDAGSFSIDPGDGDRLIGVSQSFYGGLYFFKGPQFGSVHQLSGLTPAAFSITKIAHGAPALNHRGIITTPTDVYWISSYGIHSLQTTVKYGNVDQAFLSLPIQRLWRESLLVKSDLVNSQGFWHPDRNVVGWYVTPAGQTGTARRKWALVYNYALSDPKPGGKKYWSIWEYPFGVNCAALVINSTVGFQSSSHGGERHLYLGSDQGLVYEGEYAYQDDDGMAYTATVKTPILTRFSVGDALVPETQEKSFMGLVTYYNAPTLGSDVPVTISYTVDGRTHSTGFVMTAAGDQLG